MHEEEEMNKTPTTPPSTSPNDKQDGHLHHSPLSRPPFSSLVQHNSLRQRSTSECIPDRKPVGNLLKQTIVDDIAVGGIQRNEEYHRNNNGKFTGIISSVCQRAKSLVFSDETSRQYEEHLNEISSLPYNNTSIESNGRRMPDFSDDIRNKCIGGGGGGDFVGVTQTDHLNKKLLTSFLHRINSVSSSIIDTTEQNGNGEVFTHDDILMDTIIHRIQND